MPDQISVSEFLSETTEDYNSPTTSSFTTRLQSCRNTISVLEECIVCLEHWDKTSSSNGKLSELIILCLQSDCVDGASAILGTA
ncbi:Arf-GAP with SH3 domain, ANK repeat and PH domain-containing protein 1 [Bagarius yarrelli]|uniref:Arf-GAP with SH3 domain, ANK repeat and PH domain-containing protein 1 n=1 Tax=Bagarius yarrelli TaxID=175774 RepID=A0A556TV55_BAGYA|nr:Arf-GAP with SH3 domain, ANK repeat and PH domain-containing protein 1 [Bagarius yarrelli]